MRRTNPATKSAKRSGGQRRNGLSKTPFWTTVSPHDAFAAPLAHSERSTCLERSFLEPFSEVCCFMSASLYSHGDITKESQRVQNHEHCHSNDCGRNRSEIPKRGRSRGEALRKFVANCAPNLHKIAGISLQSSESLHACLM